MHICKTEKLSSDWEHYRIFNFSNVFYLRWIGFKTEPLIIPALLAFGLTLIREIVKDLADIKGDKSAGLMTFPIVYGKKKTIILCTILSFLGLGLSSHF